MLAKKDKTFEKKDKDVTKWQCSKELEEELILKRDQITTDKAKAFAYMFCEETAQVEAMRDELMYIQL